MSDPRKTLLYSTHTAAGARIVDFSGWAMPVQYRGILEEHRAVRERCGIFDISHMGEFLVSGRGAAAWLNRLLTNDLTRLAVGQGQYTLMLNENGGVIDDLIAYRTGDEEFFLVVNAAKIAEDAQWLQAHLPQPCTDVFFADMSDEFVALAVQGPGAPAIYEKLFASPLPSRNTIVPFSQKFGDGFIGVTGYTGESGFELFLRTQNENSAADLWNTFVEAGAEPCGLGARDTLRLEMCYPLNGSDLSPNRTPLEAGLGAFVCLEKSDFIGREPLLVQKSEGCPTRLFALAVEGKGPPPRAHYPVWHGTTRIGETTSGALSPSLGIGIAMAYLPATLKTGDPVDIEIRGRKLTARITKKPFYKKS